MQKDCWTWWWHVLKYSGSLHTHPRPPIPGKFVAETPSVPWNGSQTLEVAVAWVSDASTSSERPRSPGLEWGWVPAERLRSPVACSPGRWCCDHGDDPPTCTGTQGLLQSPNPQGMHAPIEIPKTIFVRSLCYVITPILRTRKDMNIFRGPLIYLSSY